MACCLMVPTRCLAWTNVVLSSLGFCGIYLRSDLRGSVKISIDKINLDMRLLKFPLHFLRANELICDGHTFKAFSLLWRHSAPKGWFYLFDINWGPNHSSTSYWCIVSKDTNHINTTYRCIISRLKVLQIYFWFSKITWKLVSRWHATAWTNDDWVHSSQTPTHVHTH